MTILKFTLAFSLVLFSEIFKKNESPDGETISVIYVIDNGIHTSIALPSREFQKSWDSIIDFNELSSEKKEIDFLSFGWGDKDFYINTPDWEDLKFKIAVKALFWPTNSVMKVDVYHKLEENKYVKAIPVNEKQYAIIFDYIVSSFDLNEDQKAVKVAAGYGVGDAFYKAEGNYYLFKTSNTWTARGLKKAGIKTPLFPITSRPIMRKLRRHY